MSLILREGLGRKLTTEELDNNFTYLDNKPSGGSSGGYQVLGSLVVDLTLATQSLTYPIVYVVTNDSDPQFAEGDFVEAGDDIIVTGTASIYSIVFDSIYQNSKGASIYRIELTDVQGIIYDPLLGNKNNLICQASGANGEMATYYDSMGPEQEITLVGDYNVVKSVLLFNASGDISESGELVVSTGEKRSGTELLNTFISGDSDILQSFTNSNVFLEYNVDSKDASNLISNTLYVTVNKPINSGELTLIVYGYSLDSFI